ncbi:C2 family cysteine protease [Streptomyces olivoreticuli]
MYASLRKGQAERRSSVEVIPAHQKTQGPHRIPESLSPAVYRKSIYPENGTPKLSDIKQGALGSCGLLAMLGAAVHRDPEIIKRLISPVASGFSVNFSGGPEIVSPVFPTGGSGLWLYAQADAPWVAILEKAVAKRESQLKDEPPSYSSIHGVQAWKLAELFGWKARVYFKRAADEVSRLMMEASQKGEFMVASWEDPRGRHARAILHEKVDGDTVGIYDPHGKEEVIPFAEFAARKDLILVCVAAS